MIEFVSKENINEVLPLIRQYQAFYNVTDISDSKNKTFFLQFGKTSPSGCQFLFRNSSKVVGFATVYFTYTSTLVTKVAVLNDLYTLPEMRGKGVGKQLVEHCREFAKTNGAARLQWVTAPDNEQAQKLYDSLTTHKSSWLFYAYNT